MKIILSNAGKRFNREWIFRRADLQFHPSTAYAITGPNGSGKSTLLQSVGGMLQLSEGNIKYHNQKGELQIEEVYQAVSFCAPYLDLIEEMNLIEFLEFHQRFKSFLPGLDVQKVISILGLEAAAQKQIRNYSSGMKQRVKLAQAILSETPVVLLDEPCSNLDVDGITLYHSLIDQYCKERLVIVSSNDEVEYRFCKEIIDIKQYK